MFYNTLATALPLALLLLVSGCSTPEVQTKPTVTESPPVSQTAQAPPSAEVLSVSTTGSPGSYTFSVTIDSTDTGCDQYADWWEVLSEEGELIYRRVLLHSHVDEQPFTRSGGLVAIATNQVVIVRGHMHPSGYGTQAQRGTVAEGFKPVTLPQGFAAAVASQEPQPPGCNF
ncbi:MAG: hypothetical protein WA919_04060 [Coleofasciculaceae cyanobacterium]